VSVSLAVAEAVTYVYEVACLDVLHLWGFVVGLLVCMNNIMAFSSCHVAGCPLLLTGWRFHFPVLLPLGYIHGLRSSFIDMHSDRLRWPLLMV